MKWFPFGTQRKMITRSPINGVLEIGTSHGHKTLFANGVPQSGGELISMWEKLLTDAQSIDTVIDDVAVLGVGAGMIPSLISKKFPTATITGVDIDPTIIKVARDHFDLQSSARLSIDIADATQWIYDPQRKNTFDIVFMDLYINARNAPGVREPDFLVGLKKILKSHGFILYNSHYNASDPEEYERFVTLCSRYFATVEEVFAYPINKILLLR